MKKKEKNSPFKIFTRFQNPKKKNVMEIFGEEEKDGDKIFLVGEISRLFEKGYCGIKIKETELNDLLSKSEIEIVK